MLQYFETIAPWLDHVAALLTWLDHVPDTAKTAGLVTGSHIVAGYLHRRKYHNAARVKDAARQVH
jgi:hypothetical protein